MNHPFGYKRCNGPFVESTWVQLNQSVSLIQQSLNSDVVVTLVWLHSQRLTSACVTKSILFKVIF